MNITREEKLMYAVMKAIYDSGIPISFKGSMVLKACLLESGYSEEIRHTVDIDANWTSSNEPSAEQLVNSLQNAIDKSNIELNVCLYRMYGEKRSAGFELTDRYTDEILFTMDIDVNRPVSATKIYELEDIKFCGASPVQMIADKLYVISTEKVFRRIKDIVDLYYISKVFEFDYAKVMQALSNSNRKLGNFDSFICRVKDLEHSYEKFRFTGGVNKPPFTEVYQNVKAYISTVLPENM